MKRLALWLIISLLALVVLLARFDLPISGFTSDREARIVRATLGQEVSIQAQRRGNPWINLTDGRELVTAYAGPDMLVRALETNRARSLALASADFDEDGVPDLVTSYDSSEGGLITLHRGNADSIYPNSAEARRRKAEGRFTDAPFLSPATVFAVSQAADFIGAGDFDGDSHWDVVTARRGETTLHLMSGDGRGRLSESKRVELGGEVTALVTGEINRRDGLEDVVVAVRGREGAKVLVYEGPEGALRATPETIALSGEALSLALGQMDSSYEMDLAVAAGKELMIIHGRDRKLSLDEKQQAEVPASVSTQHSFDFRIKEVVIGDFAGSNETELAMLSEEGEVHLFSRTGGSEKIGATRWPRARRIVRARVSSMPKDDLVFIDAERRGLHVMGGSEVGPNKQRQMATLGVEGEPVAVMGMRLNTDALSDLVIVRRGESKPSVVMTQPSATFTVTNTNANGPGSLLFAILDANETPGVDLIAFNIPGAGPHIISPTASLPGITEPVTIDATTQPGFPGTPIIELSGSLAGAGATGLAISSGNSVVRGLSIYGFMVFGSNGYAIHLTNNGNNLVEGNFLGTGADGIVGGNSETDVRIVGSSNNTIGGTTVAARNIIANATHGIRTSGTATANQIRGNHIGIDAGGTINLGPAWGLSIGSPSNTIGGTTAGARNVILAGRDAGISFGEFESGATGNLVQGNFIGTDASGTGTVPGGNSSGIFIEAQNTTIGGTFAAARNIISGHNGLSGHSGFGVRIILSSNILVQGNFIGVDVTGSASLSNDSDGVFVNNSSNIAIGGAVSGAGNIISNNTLNGISIIGSSMNNTVQGNLIGTDVTGSIDFGNTQNGISISGSSSGNLVGGSTAQARNLISGNGLNGVLLDGPSVTANSILGNFIGTNSSGDAPLGNDLNGVATAEAPNNTIGGPSPTAGNLISASGRHGVSIGINTQSGATGITVEGNLIGTAANGLDCLGNFRDGVFVNLNSVGHTIRNNIIACNGRNGVNVPNFINSNPGIEINVRSNSIHTNNDLGVDLGEAGVTANDAGDPDIGANNLQNFPVLSSVTFTAGSLHITGNLNSTPNTDFFVQFFSSSQCSGSNPGQDQQVLTALPILFHTDASGNAPIDLTLMVTPLGGWVNALATDSAGNTSEFSACTQVNSSGCNYSIAPTDQSFASNGGGSSVTVTAGAGCGWEAASNDVWITITSGSTGTGNGQVNYSVAANTGAARSGSMTIAGHTFTVNQAQSCNYSIQPSMQDFGSAGGSDSVSVTAPQGCQWSASSNNPEFISINSGSSGSGNGQVNFSVSANTGPARSGSMTIAGLTFTVNQASGCLFTIAPASKSFSANPDAGSITVTTTPDCQWSALSNDPWIEITSGSSGSGIGTVQYTVMSNPASTPRTGTITVAGLTMTVLQGARFLDVPEGHPFFTEIGRLSARGVTLGCSAGNYCPDDVVTRQQMAAFIIRALGEFNPPPPAQQRFLDVPPQNPFYAFIEQMAVRQITLGCGGGNYCPGDPVLRDQMAAFIIRALHPPGYIPPIPPSQRFLDVGPGNAFYGHIEEMAVRQITLGCGGGNYCPSLAVSRGQMAAFLVRAFNL